MVGQGRPSLQGNGSHGRGYADRRQAQGQRRLEQDRRHLVSAEGVAAEVMSVSHAELRGVSKVFPAAGGQGVSTRWGRSISTLPRASSSRSSARPAAVKRHCLRFWPD